MTVDLDKAREWIEPLVALLTFLGAFLGATWALLRKFQGVVDGQAAIVEEMKRLRNQMLTLAKISQEGAVEIGMLKVLLSEREKDLNKLEGKVEQTNGTMMKLNGSIEKAISSLDGLWRTLQTLHPDKVPKRASDR